MKVPRGTRPMQLRGLAGVTDSFKLRPAVLEPWERDALAAGAMTGARIPLEPDNCDVTPGTFDGLELESGRAKREGGRVGLRARCRFESGGVRVVTVSPAFNPPDLFWVRGADQAGARAESEFTLEINIVDIARLQDMTDRDALTYGAAAVLPEKLKKTGTPRDWYARTRPIAWAANPWVWILLFKPHRRNVDELLAAPEEIA